MMLMSGCMGHVVRSAWALFSHLCPGMCHGSGLFCCYLQAKDDFAKMQPPDVKAPAFGGGSTTVL